jgi:hypothetical protein
MAEPPAAYLPSWPGCSAMWPYFAGAFLVVRLAKKYIYLFLSFFIFF